LARAPRLPKLSPKAARIGQLRARIARNRRSNSRLGGGAASTAASMLIDFVSGFFDIDLSSEKKSKLGMFGKALGAGASDGGVSSTPLPTMEKPTKVSNKSNPSFATITTQLEELVKTANKIGVYTKEQQETILKQINQAKRVAKEQQLENKAPPVPELPEMGTGGDLGPLDTSVNALIQKIDELSDTVDNLSGGGGLGGGGPSLERGGKGTRPGKRAPPAKIVKSPTSPTGFRYAPGSGKGGQYAKAPSWMGRATAAVSGGGRGAAARVAAPIAAGAASNKVAGLMTAGLKSSKKVGGSSIKAAVRKAAGPIIGKALGKTVLKSIPLVGAGIGAAFAVGRLMQGDVVGAGIELTSGVAGPLTAVPALAASVTRDTYASVYGVQPEQDPNFAERYKELKGEIDQMVKEQLSGAVKPMSTPTDRETGETETPTKPPQAAPVRQPPPVPAATPPAGAAGGSSAPGASSTTSSTTGGGGAAMGASSGAAMASTSGTASPQQMTPEPATGAALAGPTMETNAMSGVTLTAQQMPVSAINQSYGYSPDSGMFMPQTGNTTRGAAQGIGNIPSPVYSAPGLEGLMRTLFFDS
jgi:hypothetical protein